MESKAISSNVLYSVTSTFLVHFALWMDLLPMRAFVILCIGNLETIDSLSYATSPKVTIYFIIFKKITLINITTNLTRKSFKNEGTVKFPVMNTNFPKFWFSCQSSTFIISNKYCQIPWSAIFILFIFKKIYVKYPSQSNHNWSTNCSFKSKWYFVCVCGGGGDCFIVQFQQVHKCFPWENHCTLVWSRNALWILSSHFVT